MDDNWRHLSPVFPPLPVQAEDEEDEDFEFDLFPQFSHITLVDRARHQLYTIPEEESLEHSHHQYHHHNSINSTSTNNIPSSPMSSSSRASSLSICTSGSSSSSSLLVYRSPVAWIKDPTPDELYDSQFVGDEFYCKQKLATMIQAATAHEKEDDYGDVELFFDSDDVLRVICITRKHHQTECWRFRGNPQYIPPEMASGLYVERLADVWIMGIYLYRMLVGKYPFVAPNHRKLFGKMMHCDFSIPHQISEDAKDLLRRMLAPRQTRASLDLVLFHPWLKPILFPGASSSYLNHDSWFRSQQASSLPPTSPLPLPSSTTRNRRKKRIHCHRHIIRLLLRVLRALAHGPYPPPKKPYRELGLLGLTS
ncbi:kinase-like protein [Lichtheimia hyalospora FSU 10163]|nr:kinase-like protein [Lichtheimia hyalospora FSU 10163]